MMQAEKLAAAAADCVGAKFRLQGRDPSTGLDCVGLLVWCARQIGLTVSDQQDYVLDSSATLLTPHLIASGFRERGTLVAPAGDILIFNLNNCLNHAAICTTRGMVHADIRFRRVVEHRVDDFWQSHLAHVFCLEGE
jgi:murein DD-endopeptidase / murein LD-carboxypeptidase